MNILDDAIDNADERLCMLADMDFFTGTSEDKVVQESHIKTAILMGIPIDHKDNVFCEMKSINKNSKGEYKRTDILYVDAKEGVAIAVELKYVAPGFLDEIFTGTIKPNKLLGSSFNFMSIPDEEKKFKHPLHKPLITQAVLPWKGSKVMNALRVMRKEGTLTDASMYRDAETKTMMSLGSLKTRATAQVDEYARLTPGITHKRVVIFVGDHLYWDNTRLIIRVTKKKAKEKEKVEQ